MKLLIVAPSFKILGGVANHYMGLHSHWNFNVKYSSQGKRKNIPAIITLVPDLCLFIYKLIFSKIDVVIINPSLRNYQLKRDSIYLKIAKLFKKKVVTFIHGWDQNIANQLIENPKWFLNSYGKSEFIYCLYSGFRDDLLKIGVKCPVLLTTTKVANEILEDFRIEYRTGKINNILFLARLEESKGIYIVLKAYQELKELYPELTLTICGTGGAESGAKEFVSSNNLKDIDFRGNVKGKDLINAFLKADIYVLPTTHGEGMATSVLEAMAFGLPVITRPVGGVNDFFENGEMGYLVKSLETLDYINLIKELISNPEKAKKMSLYNHEYAKDRFLASNVVKKFESDILNHVTSQKISE